MQVDVRVELLGALVGVDSPSELHDSLAGGSVPEFESMDVWAQNEVLDFLSGAVLAQDYKDEFLALDSPQDRAEFLTELEIPTSVPLGANSTYVEEGVVFALLRSIPSGEVLVDSGSDTGNGYNRYLITAEGSDFTVEISIPKNLPQALSIRILKVAYEISGIAKVETPDSSNAFREDATVDDLNIRVKYNPPGMPTNFSAAAQPQSKPEGSMARVSNYNLMLGKGAISSPGKEFSSTIKHEMIHMLGVGSGFRATAATHGVSKWDELTQPTSNPDVEKYFGIEGRKTYQRLYGLEETPPFILIDYRNGGHTPTEVYSLMGQGEFGSLKADFGPLEIAMLKDLGYEPPAPSYNGLFTMPPRVAAGQTTPNTTWQPENALTSSNGKYTATVSDTGVITVYETDQNGEIGGSEPILTYGQADSGSNARVTLTTDGQLISTGLGSTTEVWKTNAPSSQHDDQAYVLVLTNDGDLQIRRFVIGTWRDIGNKIGEVVWSMRDQASQSTPDP
jgi:hypothetical protein